MDTRATGAPAVLETARRLADGVLFPRLVETDRAKVVAADVLDQLAEAGLYGVAGPVEAGGLALEPAAFLEVVETLASGCLATAFVWLQHHGTVRAVAGAGGELAEAWLRPLCSGEVRSGVAFAGLRRPGPPVLTAAAVDGGYLLEGSAPWLTGWGAVDVALVAAREVSTPAGDVVWTLVDAREGAGLSVERLALAAVDSTATVTARFDGYVVGADRLVAVESFEAWLARDAANLRTNGSMPLGLARRATSLLGDAAVRSRLEGLIAAARSGLDAAGPGELPRARAVATEVALEAATTLVISAAGDRSSRAAQPRCSPARPCSCSSSVRVPRSRMRSWRCGPSGLSSWSRRPRRARDRRGGRPGRPRHCRLRPRR